MKRHLRHADDFGVSEAPGGDVAHSPFAIHDEAESLRLCSSPWVAHAVLKTRSGHPQLLPSSLSRAAQLVEGRNPLVYPGDDGDVHMHFAMWDGTTYSHRLAYDAATAAAGLLGLAEPNEHDVQVREVHCTPESVAEVLGKLGMAPLPRPQLSVVPPLSQSQDAH